MLSTFTHRPLCLTAGNTLFLLLRLVRQQRSRRIGDVPLEESHDVQVRLRGHRGTVFTPEWKTDEMQTGVIVLRLLETLPPDSYGVEVTGLYAGHAWRTFRPEVFRIVTDDTEASVDAGSYLGQFGVWAGESVVVWDGISTFENLETDACAAFPLVPLGTVQYEVRPRQLPDGRELFYAFHVTRGALRLQDLVPEIEERTTVTSADAKAALDALEYQIFLALSRGQRVNLGDLGAFSITLQSRGEDSPEEVTAESIEALRVHFRPNRRWKEKYVPRIRFERIDEETQETH